MMEHEATKTGRALAALRKKQTKPCAYCGKPFEGLSRARFCCAKCRVYWNRGQKRDA